MSKHSYETHPHLYAQQTTSTGPAIGEMVYLGESGHKRQIKELVAFSAKTGFPISAEQQKWVDHYGIKAPKIKAVAKKVNRTRPAKTGTKIEKAIELFKANPAISKEDFIALLVKELEMTKLGAQTYFYQCKKAAA